MIYRTGFQKVHDSENFIDQKTEEFYESHLERINKGLCNDEVMYHFLRDV